MRSTDWKNILMIDQSDPNLSMNNLHHFINSFLDVLAPYKKLSKKELKLKSKPWINNEIQVLMKKNHALEKAFDTVNHEILIEKLANYGFRGVTQNLLKYFLTNRKQYVSVNGFDSDKLDDVCGVPQGSTLGPLLFLIYINDLRISLKSSVASHFADDTCIIQQNKKLKTIESELNHDVMY